MTEVIAVQRFIKLTGGYTNALDLFNVVNQPLGQINSAGLYPDHQECIRTLVLLHNLIGHTLKSPLDHLGIEHQPVFVG